MLSLYDIGCRWPECNCSVPYWAFSQEVRKQYCKKYLAHNQEGTKMNEHVEAPVANTSAPFSITESVEPIKHIVIKADGSQEWHDGAPAVEQASEDEIRD